jgi:hypothetical protein
MRSHLNHLTDARDELLGMDLTVEDFTSIIINSMPDSYHDLVSAISGATRAVRTTLDSDQLIILLTEEDDYRKSEQKRGKSKSDHQALNVNKGKNGKKGDLKCDNPNCNRKGHTKENCYQPGGGKEGQAPWQKDKDKPKSANKATDSGNKGDDKSGGSYAFTVFERKQYHALVSTAEKTEAAVDSGASVHYCPDRSKFVSYQTITSQNIYAADGRALEAIGKGNITIHLPNRGKLSQVTLKDVYHVPDMTTTLISVACLDNAGYFAHFGRGVCRIEAPDSSTGYFS